MYFFAIIVKPRFVRKQEYEDKDLSLDDGNEPLTPKDQQVFSRRLDNVI
jgi:hypothetical protein